MSNPYAKLGISDASYQLFVGSVEPATPVYLSEFSGRIDEKVVETVRRFPHKLQLVVEAKFFERINHPSVTESFRSNKSNHLLILRAALEDLVENGKPLK